MMWHFYLYIVIIILNPVQCGIITLNVVPALQSGVIFTLNLVISIVKYFIYWNFDKKL